ncbi:MAG: hypothetical protein ABGZ53_34320 [Fuerstiella sp.]
MKNKLPVQQCEPARFIGIDWADRKHDVHSVDPHGNGQSRTIEQLPEAIEAWISEELAQAGGRSLDRWIRMRLRCMKRKRKSMVDNYRFRLKHLRRMGLLFLSDLRIRNVAGS